MADAKCDEVLNTSVSMNHDSLHIHQSDNSMNRDSLNIHQSDNLTEADSTNAPSSLIDSDSSEVAMIKSVADGYAEHNQKSSESLIKSSLDHLVIHPTNDNDPLPPDSSASVTSDGENITTFDTFTEGHLVSSGANMKFESDRTAVEAKDSSEVASLGGLESSTIQVDELLWNYMIISSKYSKNISLFKENGIHFELVPTDQSAVDSSSDTLPTYQRLLRLKGDDQISLEQAVRDMQRLIGKCAETVTTMVLPAQSQTVTSRVFDNSSNISEGFLITIGSDSLIRLTGSEQERDRGFKQLSELFGVQSKESNDETTENATDDVEHREHVASKNTKSTLKLWDSASFSASTAADINDKKEEVDQEGEDTNSFIVEENLWRYMEKTVVLSDELKSASTRVQMEVKDVKNDDEDEMYSKRLEISFTSEDPQAVRTALAAVKQITDRCCKEVKTHSAPCMDPVVYSKIVKLLKPINKSACYVSATSATIYVTGRPDELKTSMDKLKTYGLVFEVSRDAKSAEHTGPMRLGASAASTSSTSSSAGMQSLDTGDDMTLGEPNQGAGGIQSTAEGRFRNSVPVERLLWTYIVKKLSDKLSELRNAFGVIAEESTGAEVGLTGFPVRAENDVIVTFTADTSEMLECGYMGFLQLLEQLQREIVVDSIPLQTPGGVALPRELTQVIEQQCSRPEAILEFTPQGIVIIAPSSSAVECRQKVMLILAKFQEMAQNGDGRGFPGQGMAGGNPFMGMMGGTTGGRGGGMGGMMSGMMGIGRGRGSGFSGGMGNGLFGSRGDSEPEGARIVTLPDDYQDEVSIGPKKSTLLGQAAVGSGATEGLGVTSKVVSLGALPFDDTPSIGPKAPAADDRAFPPMPPVADDRTFGPKPPVADDRTFGPKSPVSSPQVQSYNANDGGSHRSSNDSHSSNGRKVHFEDETSASQEKQASQCIASCSVCGGEESGASAGENTNSASGCKHSYCMSCMELYFDCKGLECPVCGANDGSKQVPTQPCDGRMIVTSDNAYCLPGFEKTSRGTIVITYAFPSGTQTGDLPNPNSPYQSITRTAYLPNSAEGWKVVDMLQKAFDRRLVFTFDSDGQLIWNGIHHKINIFGGPQKLGYPDPVYLRRVQMDLVNKRIL